MCLLLILNSTLWSNVLFPNFGRTSSCHNLGHNICWLFHVLAQFPFTKREMESLRKKCPNTELFLVRIFLYSYWIRRFTLYLDTFHAVKVIVWNFVSAESLSKPAWLVILQKYQSLSNQSLKHYSTHMSSLYLTPTLFFDVLYLYH